MDHDPLHHDTAIRVVAAIYHDQSGYSIPPASVGVSTTSSSVNAYAPIRELKRRTASLA